MKIWSRWLKVTWEAHGRWWMARCPIQYSLLRRLTRDLDSRLALVASDPRNSPILLKIVTFHILITHTIYTIIIHRNCEETIERKTLKNVSITHPPYYKESYSFLKRNLCSLFSFLLLLLYPLRGDLYPNTTHTHLECWECFWSLGSIGRC